MNKNNFNFLYKIGKGSSSIVYKAQCKTTKNYYAIKQISKVIIIDNGNKDSIIQEKILLSRMYHGFIVNLYCSFQDFDYLYLVIDLIQGGDLRFHLNNYPYAFTEIQIKFLLSNLLLAIGYIHSLGIMHRDIKPENILIDNRGYAYITDFGIARVNGKMILNDTCGTPGYMSPEILFELDQGPPSDFYSLGVVAFELMLGYRPYKGDTFEDIKKNIVTSKVKLEGSATYSKGLIDVVNGLLTRNPDKRLGTASGISELKCTTFFNGFDWENVEKKILQSPFLDVVQYSKNRRQGQVRDELCDYKYVNSSPSYTKEEMERFDAYKNCDEYLYMFREYTVLRLSHMLKKNAFNNGKRMCEKCEGKILATGRVYREKRDIDEGDFLNLGMKFNYVKHGNKEKRTGTNEKNYHYEINNDTHDEEKLNEIFTPKPITIREQHKEKHKEKYKKLYMNNIRLANYLSKLKNNIRQPRIYDEILDDDISNYKDYSYINGSNISKSDLSDKSKLYKNFNQDYIKYKLNKYTRLYNKHNFENRIKNNSMCIFPENFVNNNNVLLPPIISNKRMNKIHKIRKYLKDHNIDRKLNKSEIKNIIKELK